MIMLVHKLFLILVLTEIHVNSCPPQPPHPAVPPHVHTAHDACSNPLKCPEDFAMEHRPNLKFDGKAGGSCYPDEPKTANNGHCRNFNSNAPIYYRYAFCGDYMKLVWWFWYGYQKACTGPWGRHDDDWEHITINFKKSGNVWVQDSVTWFQHSGWYTRRNTDQHPDVYVGKNAHGSYDNWCDGVGAVWEQDYCAGGCGYWDDFRNNKDKGWLPDIIKSFSYVQESLGPRTDAARNLKYFDTLDKNKCKGGDKRCVGGECGCWRNDHTFPAGTCSKGGYFGGGCFPHGCFLGQGCFPGESEVTLQSGEVRSMKNLKIGDIIQTLEDGVEGKLISTPVIGFLDKRIYGETSYLVLKLMDKRSISISVRHSIFIAGEGDQLKSVLAKDVNIGDDLFIPGEQMKVKSMVVDITMETKIGAYVPLTASGTLIVDGVLVSCYTNTDHWIAHIAFAPLRWFPTLLLDNELSQEKEGIRTIPRIIRDLGNKLGMVTMIEKQSNLIRDNSFVVDSCTTTF